MKLQRSRGIFVGGSNARIALLISCVIASVLVAAPVRSAECTIVGDSSPERLVGTPGDDVICGRGGDDVISGGGGDDVISGGGGEDILKGGPGSDALVGGGGSDSLAGGGGPDEIAGGSAGDVVSGGGGNDEVSGGTGPDQLGGGNGVDEILGGSGDDDVAGGIGDDVLVGDEDDDVLNGGDGDDDLAGGPGDDLLNGDVGDDILDGEEGTDVVDGGEGRDNCAPPDEGEEQTNCEDVTPPQLQSFSIEPAVIDTSAGEQTITVKARITDDLSGLSDGYDTSSYSYSSIYLRGPEGTNTDLHAEFRPGNPDSPESNRVSGDSMDGEYELKIVVPQYSPQGTWRVQWISLEDEARNHRYYFFEDLEGLGFQNTFEQSGPGDSAAPDVTEVAISPPSVDTSQEAQTISASAVVTDDMSGAESVSLLFRSPSRAQYMYIFLEADPATGRFVGSGQVRRYAEQGTWFLDEIVAVDHANNRTGWDQQELQEKGISQTFEQTGPGDTAGPTLREFDFTPKQVNTSGGPQEITFAARITDDMSGLSEATVSMWGPGKNCTETSCPSGRQDIRARFTDATRISGTDMDGVYRVTVTLPQYSELGTWKVFVFTLRDQAGNETMLIEDNPHGDAFMGGRHGEVSALGFPISFENG